MQIRIDEQNFLDKKGIVASQNNCPLSYDILSERPTTKQFNIKHDYDNVIPVSNTFTHPNLMIDNQHEKPTRDVYRTKSGRTVKKPKRYLDEMWYDLFLTSERIINKSKQYVNET